MFASCRASGCLHLTAHQGPDWRTRVVTSVVVKNIVFGCLHISTQAVYLIKVWLCTQLISKYSFFENAR